MERSERQELVVRMLRDRPGITAAEIASRLGVGARSVMRDVAVLRERGYPIEASRGRGGGLRIHPNWGLGRILLGAEEAVGALLGLAVVEHTGLPLFAQNWRSVRMKIVAAFPEAERLRLKQLRDRILVGPAASARVRTSYGAVDSAAARALQTAFVRAQLIEFDYDKPGSGRARRSAEPHALLLNWPAWYVLGYDLARAEPRTFRLDRISAVTMQATTFRPRARAIVRAMGGAEFADPDLWSL